MLKELGPGIHGACAADDYAEIILSEAGAKTKLAILQWARSHVDRIQIRSAGPAHDGIGRGTQLQQMIMIPLAAERRNFAIGSGNFAIRRHRHVYEDVHA